jgi:hypothetical protein
MNITDKAVCLSLQVSSLGNRKKLSTDSFEVEADKTMISATKQLLDADEYNNIKKLDAEMKSWLAKRALPSFFKSGIYLIPFQLVEKVDKRLEDYRVNRDSLVGKFVNAYSRLKEEARGRLNGVFNEADYPPLSEVGKAFGVKSNYVVFDTPNALKGISEEMWQREKQRAEEMWRDASAEIQNAVRASFADLVSHMVERLAPGEDGKPKIFKETLVGNMNEFLELFEARNITDDDALAELVSKARAIMAGVDPEKLRKNKSIRESVQASMSQLKSSLDSMIVTKTSRQINLDE